MKRARSVLQVPRWLRKQFGASKNQRQKTRDKKLATAKKRWKISDRENVRLYFASRGEFRLEIFRDLGP